jgi:hypothetical protein
VGGLRQNARLVEYTGKVGAPRHVSSPATGLECPLAGSRRRPRRRRRARTIARRWRVRQGRREVGEMRPGTRPTGPAGGRGDGRARWWARSRAGQAARTGPGGGSGASPNAARSRRTACGSVTAPRIRRGPPQRGQTRTWIANARRGSWAQGQRRGTGADPSCFRASSCPTWSISRSRPPRSPLLPRFFSELSPAPLRSRRASLDGPAL